MAIVPDVHDTQGMFSKAGRFTSEKYIVFQKKDEILLNKVRYAKTSIMPEIPLQKEKNKQPFFNQENTNNKDTKSKSSLQFKSKKPELQPFSKQTSREKVQKIHLDKNQPPPCGYYHPKFSEIDIHAHKVFDYTNSLKLNQAKLPNTQSLSEEDFVRPIAEKMRQSYTCLYEMSRQVPRDDTLFKGGLDVHEKRFVSFPVNDVWSKVPRTPSVPIGSILARDQLMIYKKKNYAPDYQPKFEFGRRGLGSCGAAFQKLSKRGKLFPVTTNYNHEHYFEYDQYVRTPNSTIFPTTVSPTFNRMLEREQDNKSPLPSFMQKYVNMRMTLANMSQKTLENNNFKEGRFQTMTSSFGNQKRKIKKNLSFSEEELMDGIDEDQDNA